LGVVKTSLQLLDCGLLERCTSNCHSRIVQLAEGYYRLNNAEIATVLASSIHYDIITVVDPKTHIAAKIKKGALSQIPRPDKPSDMLCQASWGCSLD
jgi:hypothetical protein